ncbi:MAG: hypothetical protein J5698_01800 [Bacteroidaceae bacterium]|nr:hypothetical protein [Bacteroidaceae bacterium]
MKTIKKLLLLLLLIVAGAQSAWASWYNDHVEVSEVIINGITYEVCHTWYTTASIGTDWLTSGYFESEAYGDTYYASVVGIIGTGSSEIPESITSGGVEYPVRYIGMHTEQIVTSRDSTYTGYTFSGILETGTTTCYFYECVQTPVNITIAYPGKLTVKGSVDIKGALSLSYADEVEFQGNVSISNSASFSKATVITFNGQTTINAEGTLTCPQVSELWFHYISHKGKINGGNTGKLKDIYYLASPPTFSGNYTSYFAGVTPGNITIHVAGKTSAECQTMHDSWAVYSSFKDVMPYDVGGVTYKTLTVSIRCSYPEHAPVNLEDVYIKYGDERIYGGETRTFQVEQGTTIGLIPTRNYPTDYGIEWNGTIFVDGVQSNNYGPFGVQMTEDVTVVWEVAPTNYFVRVTNLSPVGSRSLYWTDLFDNTHEIAPQTSFLVPVRRSSSGVTVYALTEDNDTYEPKGYWYNGIDYMDSTDVSKGAMYYNGGELGQDEEYCMYFVLQPTADLQDRIVQLGLLDDIPTSDNLVLRGANGYGGKMWLSYELNNNVKTTIGPYSTFNGMINSLKKSNLGHSFTLKLLPYKGHSLVSLYINDVYKTNPTISGDTLIWNLGDLAAKYDVVRFDAIYNNTYGMPVVHQLVACIGDTENAVTLEYDSDTEHTHLQTLDRYFLDYVMPAQLQPSHNDFSINVVVKKNEKLYVFCNGQNVTDDFPLAGTDAEGNKTHQLYIDDPEDNDILNGYDINVYEGCSWVIIVDDGSGKYDVNGDGHIDVSDVTALVNKILHP